MRNVYLDAEMPAIADRLLNAHDAAALLGISRRTLDRLVDTGALHRIKLGILARYKLSDVQRLVERGTSASTPSRPAAAMESQHHGVAT